MSNRVRVVLFAVLSVGVAFVCGTSLAMAQSTQEETTAPSAQEETAAPSTQEETTAPSAQEESAAPSTTQSKNGKGKKGKGRKGKKGKGKNGKFQDTFPREEFSNKGTNPYFVLRPGYRLVLEGKEDKDDVRLTITVLDETKVIDGVETRVVREREEKNGKLAEISRNYFVIGKRTNNVYYFGEDVDFYNEKGEVVSHEGTWHSGENGARYGMIMPGNPKVGQRYFQEIAPGVAMDRAEHVSLTADVNTPAGNFRNTLKVRETTPLEPKVEEFKFYARGVGLVRSEDLKLINYG